MTISEAERRGRGERAGISKDRIIEAARLMEPAALTMQALADRLGVQRSALNYHVADRSELLHLVAVDVFETKLGPIGDEAADWRDAIRTCAARVRDAVLATGQFVDYFKYRPTAADPALRVFEDFLSVMTRSGFDIATAGRVMQVIADYAMAFAKDLLMSAGAEHPQHGEMREHLSEVEPTAYPAVRQVLLLDLDLYGQRQFDFAVETLITGLERSRR